MTQPTATNGDKRSPILAIFQKMPCHLQGETKVSLEAQEKEREGGSEGMNTHPILWRSIMLGKIERR